MPIAVVTGGSKGIGKAICKRLVESGYEVYCLSRTAGDNKNVNYISCDLTKEESIEKAFEQVVNSCKKIDLLVNNAGMGISGAIEFTKQADLKNMFEVNFFGLVKATQLASSVMRKQGGGKIIFISSVASKFTLPYQVFYSATKKCVNALVEGLRTELKPFNIKVCSMLLGDVKTEFTANRNKSFAGVEVYGTSIENSLKVAEHDEENGMDPDIIAKKLVKLAKKKNLPPFVVVGFAYKFLCFLGKILPKRFALWVVEKIYYKK